MRAQSIIEPTDFLGSLATFFDRTCTVQKNTPTADAVNQPQESWTDLAGHVNLPCRVAPATALTRAARVEREDMTVTTRSLVVILPGAYPSVTTAHRVVVGGLNYQIVNVVRDSAQVATELEVEEVTT